MLELNTVITEDNSSSFPESSQDAPTSNNDINGTEDSDVLSGTSGDDNIFALGGDDTIIGTTGNDVIDGGDGIDTIDFSQLNQAVVILPAGNFEVGGQAQMAGVENIIGARGQTNVIDGSSVTDGSTSLNVDLGNNSLTVENIPNVGTLNFGVENFVNVFGNAGNDRIIGNSLANALNGNNGDDLLTGAGANDSLAGGRGDDRLNGTDSLLKGSGEKDSLVGGQGNDSFILGDGDSVFYSSEGSKDLAIIKDFSIGKDTIELSSGEYTIEGDDDSNTAKLYFGDDDDDGELIAKIQFSGLGSGSNSDDDDDDSPPRRY